MTKNTTICQFLAMLVCVAGAANADIVLTCDQPGHVLSTVEDGIIGVQGATEGTLLHLTWVNSLGQTVAQTDCRVTANTIDLGKCPAGWYQLTVHRDGDPKDATIDVAFARPRSATPFDDESPYGLRGVPQTAAEWNLFVEMGGKWVQWSLPWSWAEQQPGKYWYLAGDPFGYDRIVQLSMNYGIRTVLQFREAPAWAHTGKIGSYVGTEPRTAIYPADDDHWTQFEDFEAEVINHFKALGVTHFENWSECIGSMFRCDDSPNYPKLEAYQKMLLHLRHTIDSRQLNALIVSDGGITAGRALIPVEQGYVEPANYQNSVGTFFPSPYAGMTLPGMGNQVVDIVSGHYYWVDWQNRKFFAPEEGNSYPVYHGQTLMEAVNTTRAWAGSRPIWNTEFGYGSADSGETRYPMFVSEEQQANYLVRFYLLSSAAGIKKNFYYSWRDYMSGTGLGTSYGLLRPDGVVKPAYIAYRTMTERLQGLTFDALLESGPTYWVVRYTGPRTVIVVWKVTDGRATHDVAVAWDGTRATTRDGAESMLVRKYGTVTVPLNGGEPVFLDASPVPYVNTLALSPSPTFGGSTVTGMVILSAAQSAGNLTVTLGTNNSAVAQLPATVTIPAGTDRAAFAVTTTGVTSITPVIITATPASIAPAIATTLQVYPASIATLSFTPNPLFGGQSVTGKLTLSGAAPPGGLTATLGSDNSAVAQVPSSVAIAGGATSVTFPVTTFGVPSSTTAVIRATVNGVTWAITVYVYPPWIAGLSFSPNPVRLGATVTGTISISGAAPPAGQVVTLSSSNPAVAQVPSTIKIAAGANSAAFPITTTTVTARTAVVISATVNGNVWKITLYLVP